MNPPLKNNFISLKEASKLSGYTADYLSRLCRGGKLYGVRRDGEWFVDKKELEDYFENVATEKIIRLEKLAQERATEYRASTNSIPKKTASKPLTFSRVMATAVATVLLVSGIAMADSALSTASAGKQATVASALASAPSLELDVLGTYDTIKELFLHPVYRFVQSIVPTRTPGIVQAVATPTTETKTIIERITERVIERTPVQITRYVTEAITVSGISEEILKERLAAARRETTDNILDLISDRNYERSGDSGSSNDDLDGSTITNATFSGTSVITDALTATHATTTSLYTTTLGIGLEYLTDITGYGLDIQNGQLVVTLAASPFATTTADYWLTTKDTDDLAEGSLNQYFTNARARSAFSSTATGLTYAAGTGVFSLTSGYSIPLTASTTEWNTAYTSRLSSATYPLQFASNVLSLAFGTTTANTWGSTQTFSVAPILSGLSGLLQGNGSSAVTAITGTAGQFPYYSGTNTLAATSSIFLASNGNVGIGTTTPGSLLSLGGIANFTTATSTFYGTGGINLAGGCFAVNGVCITGGGSTYTATYPVTLSGSAFGLAFGTTTANTWSALQTFGSLVATNATTTNFGLNSETFTDLTGAGLQNTAGVLTLNATGDWTGTFDGQEGSYYLARANHTGSQLASTISDFASAARALFSSTATGLTYTSGTGAFSLTSGYNIPLTASTTNWNTAFNWGNHASAGYLTSTSIDTSAELAAIVTDETGTGSIVFSASPTFTGTSVFANLSATSATTTNFAISSIASSLLKTNAAGTIVAAIAGTDYVQDVTGNWTGTFDGIEGSAYLARANHTGTQLASTISDFSTTARGLFSSSATGLTYTSGTGVFSLTSGYNIPLTASTTEWNTAYTSRISSATYPLQFASNVLSLAFGTTTANTWGALQTFGNTVATNATTTNFAISGVMSSLLKTNGSGSVIPAVAGTDYQAAGNYITALTGDLTASGPGSVSATLATVNGNTGSFGSSTAIPTFTVNAKGLITAAGTTAVIAPAGTLTGATLASNVLASSLTSVGTLSSLTSAGTITFSGLSNGLVKATSGVLSAATAGTDYENPLTFSYPLVRTTNAISLAFGTTTANTWSALQTFGSLVATNATTTNFGLNSETFTDLTGAGLQNTAGVLTLNATGDWTGTFDGQEGSYYLARANHTGTQLASTISDFASAARALFSSTATGLTYTSGTGAFSLTSGYNIPLTASTTEWSTAYLNRITSATSPLSIANNVISLSTAGDWTGTLDGQEGSYYLARANHTGTQLASTISDFSTTARGLFSSSATGLTYTSGTGAFSLTSGYEIPLTASTTNWNTFYDTPSSRITAGNALTWTGNTLAVSTTSLASGFFQQGGNSFGATAVLGTNDSNNLAFETGGSTRMTFDTSGNAGLGITVPNRTLSINGTLGFAESDGNSIWHVSSVSSALTFTKSGSFDALTISNGGNVGIGTTTPGSLLSVAGSAYASGFFNTSGITGGYKQNGTTILMASSTNFSILVGDGAGRLLDATGLRSTAVGHNALYTATSSDNNTAVGYYALRVTTSGQSNTVVGAQSLQANTTGSYNVALGDEVLLANTTGSFNTAIGSNTMRNANTGSRNFALGYGALSSNTGSDNAGIGYLALSTNTSGTDNTGIGYNAFGQNTTGSSNIGIGYTVALTNKTGTNNVAIGTAALYSNTSATSTVSIGYLAAYGSASYYNQGSVAIGYQAGRNFATGSDYNTLVGYKSGDGLTTGARNVLLGNSTIAASYNQVTTGSNNIAIGNDVAVPSATASNQLVIGNLIYGTGLSGTGATLSTGNVGIGTTSPNNKLHVYSGALEVSGAYASPLGSSVVLSQESTFAQLQSFASKPLSLNPLGNNVGIGTTTPNRALTVYSGSSQGAFQVENTSGAFVFGVDSLGGFAQPVTANKGMWFYDASGTGYMGINGATHNVGIGNAAPLSQLSNTATGDSIAGANATGFLWKSTANEWAAVVSSRPSSGNSYGLRTHASGTTASDYPFMVSSGAGAGTVHLVVTGAGNVGVGATAPGYKLEVGGTGYFGGKVAINSAALGSNSLDVFTNSPGSVAVFQNNAAAADNVLVGINSSSVTGAVEYLRGSGSATGNADIAVYNGGTGAARFRALAISTGDALATFDVNGGQAWSLGLDNSDSDSFKISGYNQLGINDYVTVKTSGNVGIGTTSPDALLTLSKAEGNTLINITNQSVAATPSQFKLRFDTSGNTIMENMRTAGGANQLVLGVTGNVGIGTTEPTGKLTIYDTTVGYPNPQIKLGYSAGLDYVIGRNNSTGFLQFVGNESTYSGFSFSTAAVANAVNIINNGNVGIGNSSPTYKLDIATSSAGTSNSLIRLKNTPTDALSGAGIEFNGYYNGGRIRGYSVSPGTVYTGGMQFDVNNVSNAWATAMTIQGDGNVGIGTTTPASTSYDIDQNLSITTKLHVSNAIRAEAGGFFIGHEENYASNQGGAHFTYDPVGNKAYIGGFKQGVGANALILQGNGGNVGIGTTGPGVKLDIQTTGANDAITRIGTTLSAANGSTAELHLSPASDYSISNDPRIYSYVDNSGTFSAGLRFDTFKSGVGRYNALTILGDGNVGIGTTSPQSLLHLAETSTAGSTLIIESNGASAVGAGIRLRHARGTVAAPTNTVAGDTTGLIAGQAYSGTGFLSTAEIDFLTESTAFTSGLRPASAISFYTNPANGSQTEQLRITSAGNVGIGTTTPSSLMHVAGSTGSALNYILEPTGWSGLKHRLGVQYSGDTPVFSNNTLLTSATAGTLDNTAQTGSALILGGSGSLNYVQASAGSGSRTFTSRVYIDSAGSVGISTTDPGAKLDVVTGINSAIQQWQGAGTNFKLKLTSGDGSVQDSVAYRLALDYLNGSYTNGFIDFYRGGDGASGFLTLGTANTERMRIDASGKVGVGTTLPLSKQHLAGSAQTATAGASDILTLERPFNNGVSFGRFGTIALGSADATSNGAGRMDFRLNPTSSGIAANPTVMPTLTTVLTLLGDGNVGIGTAAPDYTLHVRKDGDDSNPRLAITNTSTGTSARTSVQFINDTTGTAFVGVNGNGTGPGIGYPDALLAQTDKSAGLVFISGHASGIIRMVTGGTAGTNERLRIDASGNVGIGTTTPASTSGVNLTIGGIEPSIVLGSSAGAKTFSIASGGNYQYTPSSLVFHDNTAGATRMIINSTGNVGIGTTNPANFNLQVSASGSSWGGARIGLATIGSSGSGYPLIGDGIRFTSTGDSYLYDRNDTAAAIDFASGNIKFRTAVSGTAGNAITFSNRMTILNSNGNVGIGTTAPDNPLTIESNTNQLRLNSASDSSNYYATIGAQYNYSEAFVLKAFGGGSLRTLMSWSEPNGMALHSGNAPLILKTNDVERMRVSADGNVGIGTTTPAVAKLSVTTSGTKAIHLEGAYGSATPLTISTNYVGTPHVKTEIQFLNPSNGYGGGIAFATQPETLNAAVVERMRVGADGNIFVGTTTTGQYTSRLDIAFGGGGQEYGIELRPAVESTVAIAFQNAAGSNVGSISTGNSTTAYNTSSDRRLKENIVLSTRGIETLRRVGVQEYNFISDPGNRTQGYIAQDLYEVYPEAVHVGSDITRPWAVDYGRMTPLIVKSIQDLDLRTIALAPAAQNTQALSLIVSTDASIAGKLTVSGTSTFNDALTTVGSVTATAFLTETTETLPEEVYTGGKADLYKMGSYALSSAQESLRRTDLILDRLASIDIAIEELARFNDENIRIATSTTPASAISAIEDEPLRRAVSYITDLLTSGHRPLADFVAARVTAVQGYFGKVHADEICLMTTEGVEVCITGNELRDVLETKGIEVPQDTGTPPIAPPEETPIPEGESEEETIGVPLAPVVEEEPEPEPTPVPEPTSAPVPEPAPAP